MGRPAERVDMRRIGSALLVIGLLAAAVGLAGAAPSPGPAAVDAVRMANASADQANWLAPGRTYDEQRFSPLTQINVDTVGKLGIAWYADLGTDRGVEASPLVIDGVLYNTQPWNVTTAYDAKTGKVLWSYDPQVPRDIGRLACCDIVTRGISAWKGKIYVATLDGRLIALDARNGKPMWSVQTFEKNWPYVITGAPRVFDGKVVIGNAGGEGAARGYVSGYDAETGKKLWRFYIVPGDPKDGYDKAMAMAAKTWSGKFWEVGGGGGAWDSIVYDPKLKLVYIGTGNGGPWAQKYRSPEGGDNLFTSSIVALHVDSGKYAWHYQEVPGDEWDYDATQSLVLADIKLEGRTRQVIMHAPKNGFYYVIDRATGALLSAEKFVPVSWAKGIDKKTGKAIVNPEARYGLKPVLVTPSPAGGHNWNPMAYSPQTGLVYFPALESYMALSLDPNYKFAMGQMHQLGTGFSGDDMEHKRMAEYAAANTKVYLLAWDPVKQKEVWRVPAPKRGGGGILATAGNLIFEGTIGETLAAYRADTGAKVWEMPVQQVPIAAPISYMVDGVQYIAVNAGWGGGLAHGPVTDDFGLNLSPSARLMVFKLGGDVQLPPLAEKAKRSPPPAVTGTAAQIKHGAELYAKTCSGCHGEQAKGGIKDLRMLTPETHAQFQDIVIGGIRQSKGMVSFASVLSKADADDIHQYLISRANEDWAQIKAGK
jgi:quinohemoprotein ethanol dehydrogenase